MAVPSSHVITVGGAELVVDVLVAIVLVVDMLVVYARLVEVMLEEGRLGVGTLNDGAPDQRVAQGKPEV